MTGPIILPPYARGLGFEIDHWDDGVPVLGCDFGPRVLGRPGFWHGGAISGLLEMAAVAAVHAALKPDEEGERRSLKPVNVTVQFMRGGLEKRRFAIGRVIREGRRLANVSAEAWQDDRSRPVAMAQLHGLIGAPSA